MSDDRSLTPAPFHKLEGRAYTLAEKKAVLDAVLEAWSDAKDLRLGQLLVCATPTDKDLFYIEDFRLVGLLAEFKSSVTR